MKIDKLKGTLIEKRPEILMGLGITGMFASMVLAVKATPKVYDIIKDEQQARESYGERDLDKLDIVKLGWKHYIPAGVLFGLSSACLLSSNTEYAKRSAALAAAYGISEKALNEYRNKIVETFGEDVEKGVRDAISKDRIDKDPKTKEVVIAGEGQVLCYDTISGRYFKSTMDRLKKAENKLNYELLHNVYFSLNDFYDELDLSSTDVGRDLGWNVDDGLIEIYYSSQITETGVPCIVINYTTQPKYGFSKMS